MRTITSTTISRATIILLLILAVTAAFAQAPPALSGRVIDATAEFIWNMIMGGPDSVFPPDIAAVIREQRNPDPDGWKRCAR